MSARPLRDPATIPQPGPDEVLIEISEGPDYFGRVTFMAWWHEDYIPGAPGLHTRGQIFVHDLDDFIRRDTEAGKTVRIVADARKDTP